MGFVESLKGLVYDILHNLDRINVDYITSNGLNPLRIRHDSGGLIEFKSDGKAYYNGTEIGSGGGGGITDHGALNGLGDDDHTQYYNAARHTKAVHDALNIDADTLDGLDSTDFALVTGTPSHGFILDINNTGAEASTALLFNRGNTVVGDAAVYWNSVTDLFLLYSNTDTNNLANLEVNDIIVAGGTVHLNETGTAEIEFSGTDVNIVAPAGNSVKLTSPVDISDGIITHVGNLQSPAGSPITLSHNSALDVSTAKVAINGTTVQMFDPLDMNSNKITELGAATSNGDAVRYEHYAADNHTQYLLVDGSRAMTGALSTSGVVNRNSDSLGNFIQGGLNHAGYFTAYGKDAASAPGSVWLGVTNAAKTGTEIAIHVLGVTDTPTVDILHDLNVDGGLITLGAVNNTIQPSDSVSDIQMFGGSGSYESSFYISGNDTGANSGDIGMYVQNSTKNSIEWIMSINGLIVSPAVPKVIFYGDIYVGNNCSALSFTDRTPSYKGDAVSEIMKIKENGKNDIDHTTLPKFAQKKIKGSKYIDDKKVEFEEDGRDIGAMVSVLTVAIQQLSTRISKLEDK